MGGCYSISSSGRSFIKKQATLNCLPSVCIYDDDNIYDDDDEEYRCRLLLPGSRSSLSVVNGLSAADFARRYKFGPELGRGEFGVTRRCTDTKTGEALACKTISKRKLRNVEDVAGMHREVEIMRAQPEHPNIVRLREAYEDGEAVHLIMEVCEGGELFDRIVAKGQYSERAAAAVFRTIAEVVQQCHKHGIIHRDLKPENFLFANKSEDSPLKAIDFGLSVFFKPGQRFSEVVGSQYYIAPEVLKRSYGPEIDVWSAGVILYILLCGVPPFFAFSIYEEHPWLQNANMVPNTSLGETVRSRLQQFSTMNKFKNKALLDK